MRQSRKEFLADIAQSAEVAMGVAKDALAKARRLKNLLKEIRRHSGKKWKSVGRVKLRPGRLYLVRRVIARSVRYPCLYRWTKEGGWQCEYRHMEIYTGSYGDLQVFV